MRSLPGVRRGGVTPGRCGAVPMQQGDDLGEPAPPPIPASRGTRIASVAMSLIAGVITLGLTDGHLAWPWVLLICISILAAAILTNRILRRP